MDKRTVLIVGDDLASSRQITLALASLAGARVLATEEAARLTTDNAEMEKLMSAPEIIEVCQRGHSPAVKRKKDRKARLKEAQRRAFLGLPTRGPL